MGRIFGRRASSKNALALAPSAASLGLPPKAVEQLKDTALSPAAAALSAGDIIGHLNSSPRVSDLVPTVASTNYTGHVDSGRLAAAIDQKEGHAEETGLAVAPAVAPTIAPAAASVPAPAAAPAAAPAVAAAPEAAPAPAAPDVLPVDVEFREHEAPRLVFRPVPHQRHDEQEKDRPLRPLPGVHGRPIGRLAYADNSSPLIASRDLDLIRVILRDHGYERAPIKPGAAAPAEDWTLFWYANDLQSDVLSLLRSFQPYQRINKLPGSAALTNKANLYKCFKRMQDAFGFKAFSFMPFSFVLPAQIDDCEEFMRQRTDEQAEERDANRGSPLGEAGGDVYILKPAVLSRGHGISLYRPGPESGWGSSWDASFRRVRSHTGLLSTYIHPPLLLDGLKFDLRMYVLVTSVSPLCVYVFREGLTRFATERYDITQISNRFQHLTNYSLNKKSANFVPTTSEGVDDDGVGSKWSLSAFRRRLVSEFGQDVADVVWRDVDDLLVKTALAAEPSFHDAYQAHSPAYSRGESPKHCFQIFGFDIMLDAAFKPWLLEVNCDPALGTEQPMDLKVKGPMLTDALNLVGMPTPPAPPGTPDHGNASNRPRDGAAGGDVGGSGNPFEFASKFNPTARRGKYARTPLLSSDFDKWSKTETARLAVQAQAESAAAAAKVEAAAEAAAAAAEEEEGHTQVDDPPEDVDPTATDDGEPPLSSASHRRRQQEQQQRRLRDCWAMHIVNAEFARSRSGGWRRLFPSPRGKEYLHYFASERRHVNALPFEVA